MGGQSEGDERVSLELTDEVVRSMEVGSVFGDYNCKISSMDFHKASNYLVTASDDESIRLYDVTSATCLKTVNSKKYGVDLVCFTSHPTTVIYSSKNGWDESLRLLTLLDYKYLRYFKGHHDRVVSLSLCPPRSDCFISGSLDRTVLLWDQRADKCQGLIRVQGRPAVSYDEQGMIFAIAYGGYVRMFDARKYEKGPFENFAVGDYFEANKLEFSTDGRLMLITTTAGQIYVLDSFRGIMVNSFNVKGVSSEATLDACFSPDGSYVVSGSGDGSVTAWNIRTGKEMGSWVSTELDPPVIKWCPGSLMFATGSTELSLWTPDLSKISSFVGSK